MWKIKLGRGSINVCIYLAEDPFQTIFKGYTEENKMALLQNLAAKLFKKLYPSYPNLVGASNSKEVFVKSLYFPDSSRTDVVVHYAERSHELETPVPTVDIFEWEQKKPLGAYLFDITLTTRAEEKIAFTFETIFTTQVMLKWLQYNEVNKGIRELFIDLEYAVPLPPKITLPIALDTASDHDITDTLNEFCQPTLGQHLLGRKNLASELNPLIVENAAAFNTEIHKKTIHDESADLKLLSHYIKAERNKLVTMLTKTKRGRIEQLIRNNESNYSLLVADAQPTNYRHTENTYYYIKKNIIAAVYNAACDYYKDICAAGRLDPSTFPAKLLSFNEKFADIATISYQTLALSPISLAFSNLLNIDLVDTDITPGFASRIDNILKRCAHVTVGNTYMQSYDKAFESVKIHLNEFLEIDFISPTPHIIKNGKFFDKIKAPGELLRNMNILGSTLGAVFDFTKTGAEKLRLTKQKTEFCFAKEVSALPSELITAKEILSRKISNVDEYIIELKIQARNEMAMEEDAVNLAIANSNSNINAFADLLKQKSIIDDTIHSLNPTVVDLLAKLEHESEATSLFVKYAKNINLDIETTETLAAAIFSRAVILRTTALTGELKKLRAEFSTTQMTVNKLVKDADKHECLHDTEGYLHRQLIQDSHARLDEIKARITVINQETIASQKLQHHAWLVITTMNDYHDCNQSLIAFNAEYTGKLLAFPTKQNFEDNLIDPALRFYSDANVHLTKNTAKVNEILSSFKLIASQYNNPALESFTLQLVAHLTKQQQITETTFDDSKIKSNTLLLCHMYANAILNFSYWNHASGILDTKINVRENLNHYQIHHRINLLAALIKSNEFTEWQHNPKKALDLMQAMKVIATFQDSNPKIEQLLRHIRLSNIDAISKNTNALLNNITVIHELSNRNPLQQPILITSEYLENFHRVPTFWEKHPLITKTLIGAALGCIIAGILALTVAAFFASGGMLALALTTAACITVVVSGAAIGFGKGFQLQKTELHSAIHADEKMSVTTSTRSIFSRLGNMVKSASAKPLINKSIAATTKITTPIQHTDTENIPVYSLGR